MAKWVRGKFLSRSERESEFSTLKWRYISHIRISRQWLIPDNKSANAYTNNRWLYNSIPLFVDNCK